MAFSPFRKIRLTPNTEITAKHINDVQDNVDKALSQLLGKDELDQNLLTNITLQPGIINKVSHGLGRTLQGWFVVRNHGGYAALIDMQDTNLSPNLLLYLMTPVITTVDLLVF